VAVRRAHHGNLDALIGQSSDTSGPFSFDRGPPFELEAELLKEINRLSEVIYDDSYVVHPFERHVSNLQQRILWNAELIRRSSLWIAKRTPVTALARHRRTARTQGQRKPQNRK